MPHTKSAWKRLRSSETRRVRNRVTMKALKLQTRKFADAIKTAEPETAVTEGVIAVKKLDKAAARGVIHKNKAARLKSKMAKKLNALAADPAAAKAAYEAKAAKANRGKAKKVEKAAK